MQRPTKPDLISWGLTVFLGSDLKRSQHDPKITAVLASNYFHAQYTIKFSGKSHCIAFQIIHHCAFPLLSLWTKGFAFIVFYLAFEWILIVKSYIFKIVDRGAPIQFSMKGQRWKHWDLRHRKDVISSCTTLELCKKSITSVVLLSNGYCWPFSCSC